MPAKEWRVTRRWLETVLTAHHNRPPDAWELHGDAAADAAGEGAATARQGRLRVKVCDFEVSRGTTGGIGSLLSEILSVRVDYELLPSSDGGEEKQAQSLRLLLKLPPKDPVTRAFVTEAQFHLREIKFYTEVVPELMEFQHRLLGDKGPPLIRLPVPRCYYAWHYGMHGSEGGMLGEQTGEGGQGQDEDDEDGEAPKEEDFSVLVLEDLRASGYSVGDFSRGLTAEQASAALDAVARLHALSLAYGILGSEGSMEAIPDRFPFLFRATPESCRSLVGRGLPQLASFLHRHRRRPRASAHPRLLHRLLHLVRGRRDGESAGGGDEDDALAEADFWGGKLLFGGGADDPEGERGEEDGAAGGCPTHGDQGRHTLATLTHSDFWSGNLLFRENPDGTTDCMVVDWQMLSWGRPTDDAALLLLSSLPSRLRRGKSRELLGLYWRSLLGHAKSLSINIGDEGRAGGRGGRAEVCYNLGDLAGDFRRSRVLALLLVVGSVDVALGDADAEERLLDLIEDVEEGGEEGGRENGAEEVADEEGKDIDV
ncbi:uncharacterized protein LOC124164205 isoform X2 [Ischnura elegans]|nr:uncharacterized protein LOC124164205 isoform X2 [Ischnura elegans]